MSVEPEPIDDDPPCLGGATGVARMFVVELVEIATGQIVGRLKPMSDLDAIKVERGLRVDLDERFAVRLVAVESSHDGSRP